MTASTSYYLTVVVAFAVLLLVSGSTGSTAATDAVLVTVPFLLGRTTIVTVADAPSPRFPSAQLTAVFCALALLTLAGAAASARAIRRNSRRRGRRNGSGNLARAARHAAARRRPCHVHLRRSSGGAAARTVLDAPALLCQRAAVTSLRSGCSAGSETGTL